MYSVLKVILEKIKKLDLKTLLIMGLGLIVVILLLRACNENNDGIKPEIIKVNGKKYEVLDRKVDTVYIPKDTIVYRSGKTIWKDKPVYIDVPANVDSSAVVRDYYSKIVYKDTLKLNEDIGYITVIDTVSQNKIVGRLWNTKLKQKTIHETTIVKELPKMQMYIGGTVGFDSKSPINFIGPTLLMKTKSDKIYALSAGYGVGSTVVIQGGILWKIRLKK